MTFNKTDINYYLNILEGSLFEVICCCSVYVMYFRGIVDDFQNKQVKPLRFSFSKNSETYLLDFYQIIRPVEVQNKDLGEKNNGKSNN